MKNLWIFKFDGTIQCDSGSLEISLQEMRKILEDLVGAANVLDMEKRQVTVIQQCGTPTGSVNAYEVTQEGWFILNHGIVGNPGFKLWRDLFSSSAESAVSRTISTLDTPVNVRDLIGRPLRVYKTGEPTTDDWIPERVNIETSDVGIIVDIWFG